ncbi:hypothetical protein BGZ57DRAFT_856285 [Hyaloscypha finlandica]|nr:hypothetical protein BGZ57DRAFT_856285 [Hyaloscypha finlandica]
MWVQVDERIALVRRSLDRALAIWSPANQLVRYHTATNASYFVDRSLYLGAPPEGKVPLWEALYDFGITGISEYEASKLLNETLPAPNNPTKYVVQLDLHCLDVLRKAIYPDEYPDGWTYHNNGTVNHNSVMGLHWDITPVTFKHGEDNDYNIIPKLSATHNLPRF